MLPADPLAQAVQVLRKWLAEHADAAASAGYCAGCTGCRPSHPTHFDDCRVKSTSLVLEALEQAQKDLEPDCYIVSLHRKRAHERPADYSALCEQLEMGAQTYVEMMKRYPTEIDFRGIHVIFDSERELRQFIRRIKADVLRASAEGKG